MQHEAGAAIPILANEEGIREPVQFTAFGRIFLFYPFLAAVAAVTLWASMLTIEALHWLLAARGE